MTLWKMSQPCKLCLNWPRSVSLPCFLVPLVASSSPSSPAQRCPPKQEELWPQPLTSSLAKLQFCPFHGGTSRLSYCSSPQAEEDWSLLSATAWKPKASRCRQHLIMSNSMFGHKNFWFSLSWAIKLGISLRTLQLVQTTMMAVQRDLFSCCVLLTLT